MFISYVQSPTQPVQQDISFGKPDISMLNTWGQIRFVIFKVIKFCKN